MVINDDAMKLHVAAEGPLALKYGFTVSRK